MSPWGRHFEYMAVSATDGLFCCLRERLCPGYFTLSTPKGLSLASQRSFLSNKIVLIIADYAIKDIKVLVCGARSRSASKDYPINLAERLISVPANSLEIGHFSLAV
jgi:hypothetical protein